MKIVITLTDAENGHVRVDTNPSMERLIQIWRNSRESALSPALTYAVLGLKKMLNDSDHIENEQERERQDQVARSKLIIPDPRIQ